MHIALLSHVSPCFQLKLTPQVVLRANSDALLNFETRKVGAGDMTQSFGGHTDSTPHGHSSVGLDFVFEGAQHVYGIPSHATSLALKPTKYEAL